MAAQGTGAGPRSTTARTRAFWAAGATLTLFLFGASAPSPLYAVYQTRFGFSPTVLTAIFAVYALALLAALLPAGRVSDEVGRRPVIAAALVVQIAATVLFLLAQGVAVLFAARIVQGLATGMATGALSAALVDLQPAGSTRGSLVASVAPSAGLALGALVSGALVQYAALPLRMVYWVQLALLLVALAMVQALLAAGGSPRRGRLRLDFAVRIPGRARGMFLALTPGLVGTWALAGLYLSLGPSLVAVVLGEHSHVTGALIPATLCAFTAAASILTRDWGARLAVVAGCLLLALGVAVTLGGIRSRSGVLLFAGSALAGIGFGPAFAGSFRTLAPLAGPDERASLLAAVYLVSYLAFSLPAVLAGLAVTRWGLRDTASAYALVVIALAVAAAVGTERGLAASAEAAHGAGVAVRTDRGA